MSTEPQPTDARKANLGEAILISFGFKEQYGWHYTRQLRNQKVDISILHPFEEPAYCLTYPKPTDRPFDFSRQNFYFYSEQDLKEALELLVGVDKEETT